MTPPWGSITVLPGVLHHLCVPAPQPHSLLQEVDQPGVHAAEQRNFLGWSLGQGPGSLVDEL